MLGLSGLNKGMSEKADSSGLNSHEQKTSRLNKALRQNLRKRKVDPANADGLMQRRNSAISKRTGPKLKRPD